MMYITKECYRPSTRGLSKLKQVSWEQGEDKGQLVYTVGPNLSEKQ